MFHYLEEYLERRLFWIVCQLHTYEFKLRRLISKRDGKSNSKDRGRLGGGPGEAVADCYVSSESPHISGDSGKEKSS